MLWASVIDATGRCEELAQAVTTIAAECGVTLADKPFAPHVTLVRARRPRRMSAEVTAVISAEALGDGVSMSVPSATLYSSTLTPVGPVYERLAQWSLTESA
jgi:2'-5' RNA ligase